MIDGFRAVNDFLMKVDGYFVKVVLLNVMFSKILIYIVVTYMKHVLFFNNNITKVNFLNKFK